MKLFKWLKKKEYIDLSENKCLKGFLSCFISFNVNSLSDYQKPKYKKSIYNIKKLL